MRHHLYDVLFPGGIAPPKRQHLGRSAVPRTRWHTGGIEKLNKVGENRAGIFLWLMDDRTPRELSQLAAGLGPKFEMFSRNGFQIPDVAERRGPICGGPFFTEDRRSFGRNEFSAIGEGCDTRVQIPTAHVR